MIGQKNLQSRLDALIATGRYPRFVMLVGDSDGTAIMANYILTKIQDREPAVGMQLPDVKADTVREFTSQVYKFAGMTNVIMIVDADNMSLAAKNALLKVTEEPPNDTYFIMTLEDENNTLDTIKSRATIFRLDAYTPDEIFEYYWTVGDMPNDAELVREMCETPSEVKKCIDMCKGTIQSFYDYVQLVVDNIAEVSIANAFKIGSKIALKDDTEGYDLRLFWKAFMKVCLEKADNHIDSEDISRYGEACLSTSKYLQKLKVKGANKQMLFDNWILEMREIWA